MVSRGSSLDIRKVPPPPKKKNLSQNDYTNLFSFSAPLNKGGITAGQSVTTPWKRKLYTHTLAGPSMYFKTSGIHKFVVNVVL